MGLAANTGEGVEAVDVDVEAAAVLNDEDGGYDDGKRRQRQMTGTLTHRQDGTRRVMETMETALAGGSYHQYRGGGAGVDVFHPERCTVMDRSSARLAKQYFSACSTLYVQYVERFIEFTLDLSSIKNTVSA
ncbi:hypothetical protein DPX16_6694 [Anabarilius grahami]|uniref:Uncharacterized protein n=1 Tax=Anabarilius grahami TaxID=495550 RepID=A0A3N0YPR7_ANAGA|nr:hypothetical protein DPX16_6694 [Anabarilius grahami]